MALIAVEDSERRAALRRAAALHIQDLDMPQFSVSHCLRPARRSSAARSRCRRRASWSASARAAGCAGSCRCSGPAFVAAIAYVDPGNFATNIAGGAEFGYTLLWVVLAANLMGMLIQTLSAKVGLATGRNLPELCRDHLPRPASWGLWVQAEVIAMSTDLAEFVGAAIALNLLFGVPLFVGRPDDRRRRVRDPRAAARGYRRFELAIGGDARDHPARLPLRDAEGRRRLGRGRGRLRAGLRRAATRCCSPPASSARPSCRT